MAMSRRALGVGILATSAVVTGAAVVGRNDPLVRSYLSAPTKLFGFVGGEKERFVANPDVVSAIRSAANLELDSRRAGSVEMSRERQLLDQKPQFLWPSSSVLVDLARQNGVPIKREQVILNSPIVIYSWDVVARGLVSKGLAEQDGPARYKVDLTRLLTAILENKTWADLGVPSLYGKARMLSTDPNKSNSGFMFAGLSSNVFAGEVATAATLQDALPKVADLFARMGYKPSSSGKMFEDYLAAGPGGQPLAVGYENQLVEWVLEDQERWKRLEGAAPAKPVILYPTPTVFSAHPLLVTNDAALELVGALMTTEVQKIAWDQHGFRGPLGLSGDAANPLVADRIRPQVDAIMPMPDIRTMLTLIDRLAA